MGLVFENGGLKIEYSLYFPASIFKSIPNNLLSLPISMIKLGQRLREQRLEQGLSLDDVAKATKIRQSFLAAIEKGEYHKLPSSSYVQGFVANYAQFLGLPRRQTLALFRREFDEATVFAVLPERFAHPVGTIFPRMKFHEATVAISIAFLSLFGYLLFSYKDAFINPPLTVDSPKNGAVTSGEITIIGKTNPYATVTINDTPVSLENNGKFMKHLTLFTGKTTIIVKAKNRFGKETVEMRTVNVKE